MMQNKGPSRESQERLARAIIDAAAYREPVVGVVTSVANLANGSILCDIGTMLGVQVIARPIEGIAVADSIFVKKIGSGPTSRWMFDGFNVGGGGGGSGTGKTPVQRIETLVPHASRHEDGGSDEISVTGLSGDLADPQDPKSHASTHQDGGADEISVTGLSGDLADQQDANKIKGVDVIDTAIGDGKVLVYRTGSGDLGYETQAGGGGADEKVKVSSDDTTADYLINKLTAQGPITLTEVSGGGNEDLQIGHARGNIKWVAKSGGDYSTVTAALAAITDADTNNRYAILIAPDLGFEAVTLKSYVDLIGFGTHNLAEGFADHLSLCVAGAPTDVSIMNLHLCRPSALDASSWNTVRLTGGNVDFHHCRIRVDWWEVDGFYGSDVYISDGAHRFYDCEIENDALGLGDRGGNAVTMTGGTATFYGGHILANGYQVGGGNINHGIYLAGGTVNLHQGVCVAGGVNNYAIKNVSGTVNVYSAEYDPDTTTGTITGADKDLVVGDLTVIDDLMLNGISHGEAEPFDAHLNNPSCRVYHNAYQSIPNATWTWLSFNSERWDTDSIHDTVTNNSRLTCRTAGKYQISLSVVWAANATGQRGVGLRVDGATYIVTDFRMPNSAGILPGFAVSTLWNLAVDSYVELGVYQESGGNLNINSSASNSPEFMMVRVG